MKRKPRMLVFILAAAFSGSSLPVTTHGRAAGEKPTILSSIEVGPVQQVPQAVEALRQGRALLKRGKADDALPQLENALKLFTDANDVHGQAAAHDALGDLYTRQGQYQTALTHYKSAHENFQTEANKESAVARAAGISDNSYNADLMLAKIGDTYYRIGNIAEAGSAYGQMVVQKPNGNPVTSAKKGFGALGSLKNIGRSIGNGNVNTSTGTGLVSAVGSLQQAFELYHQTIIYSTHEIGLGRVDYYNGNLDGAKIHFQNALDTAGGSTPLIGKLGQTRRFRTVARTSLGDIALRQIRLKDALKLYTDAANGAKADNRLDLMWPAQRGIGKARLLLAAQEKDATKRTKAFDDAIASYRDALQTIEKIRQGSLRADEARTTFLATTKEVFDEASSALAERALETAPTAGAPLEGQSLNYAAEAFRIIEAGRARSLLDMLNEAGANITEGVPADLLKRKQDNLERQQEIAQQLSGVNLTGEPPKESVDKLEDELESLSTEFDSIENQIRSASPRYAALTASQPLTLAEVQQQVLDDQTALVEYSLGADQSYLWATTRKGISLYKLPARNEVEKQAAALRDQIVPQSLRRSIIELAGNQTRGLADERGLGTGTSGSSANATAFANASNALYQTILAPVATLIKDKRLLVVADGALNYIPFESLVTAGGGMDYASLPYLVKTNEVIYAPSASVVAAIRQQSAAQSAASNARGLLVVADPVFDAKDPRAKNAQGGSPSLAVESAITDITGAKDGNGPSAGFKLARLAGTRAEAQQIAGLARTAGLSPDVWLDLDANESNVKMRDISKYRVLHLATHGLLNTERPQFTGVVLSLVGNREGDGFLRTDEIFNLHLGSPLVMLSACETGLGKERRGEGVIGLTRAFMYAGAPTVGVSLWSVADRSTADLMIDFYKRLLGKQPVTASAALRAAQTSMIDGKKFSAPFYWAPFVLIGDWK